MGAWNFCVLSAGKPMSIKFLVLGGGILGLGGGGGEGRFYFYGRGDFSDQNPNKNKSRSIPYGGAKQGRFGILRFPLFCSIQDNQMLGKRRARKVSLSHPFFVCPKRSQKLGFESSVPICWQAEHGKSDKGTPLCPCTSVRFKDL